MYAGFYSGAVRSKICDICHKPIEVWECWEDGMDGLLHSTCKYARQEIVATYGALSEKTLISRVLELKEAWYDAKKYRRYIPPKEDTGGESIPLADLNIDWEADEE